MPSSTARPHLTDWAMSSWTKSFWLGGTPNPEINIDNNLAYLELTRFVPNYDPSITRAGDRSSERICGYWTNAAHDLYDGTWDGGAWPIGMSTTGAAPGHRAEPDLERRCGSTPATGGCGNWRSAWPISPRPGRPICARATRRSG